MSEQERWLPVAGWPGYEVSSLGNVRSFRNTRGRPTAVGHVLKPTARNTGHLCVKLRCAGAATTRSVHRIVMEAFVGLRPEGSEVRHLDGDPTNNALSNMVYGTRSENNLDRVRHGTHNNANKTHCPHGHPYDEANTYVDPSRGTRSCRTCKMARLAAAECSKREAAGKASAGLSEVAA